MRRGNGVVVSLSVLLAISFVGCNGCGEDLGDDVVIVDRSESMREWERKIEKARTGERVDFDGDGFEEYLQWTDKDGVIHVEIKSPTGSFSWVSERHPDGTKIIFYDADGDGNIDKRIEESHGRQIYYISSNGDGVFDERVTITFDFEKGEKHRIFEEINSGGAWEIISEETVPIRQGITLSPETEMAMAAQESLIQGFVEPQYAKGSRNTYRDIGNNFQIKTGGSGSCNDSRASRIQKAFDTIFSEDSKVLECLSVTNSEIGGRLRETGKIPTARIDCGLSSRYAAVADVKGDCASSDKCSISINPKTFEKYNDTDLMSTILHEYLHLLGFDNYAAKTDRERHDKEADDTTYSCGRYCGGCSNAGAGASGNLNTECTRCADSREKAETCNPSQDMKEKIATGDCPTAAFGQQTWLCGSGLACLGSAKACKSCTYTTVEDCNGNLKQKFGRFLCCNSCPDSCSSPNDYPCLDGTHTLHDTCGQSSGSAPPPLFCQKN